ncbi:hypothetical protein [Maridesulfovibrio ferrireducens]|uniref:hypothetical protein n=1 Tax=Maridesulfovibrio ferrireducens TaxID=246191 RepID=UPI001A2CCD99|nr:hypothetical protein [Maridesulfovibrio ferrireducens]MBI9109903.1 hypothetical protein [Maridesulfovibrio ferrireducens]
MSDSAMTCDVDSKKLLRLREQLEILALTPKQRKIFNNKVGGDIRKRARRNTTRRTTIDGKSMESRKKRARGRHKNKSVKMFRNLNRFMGIIPSGKAGVSVSWRNPVLAQIAYQHQHGAEVQSGHILLTKQLKREKKYVSRRAKCPRWLAKELVENRYRHTFRNPGQKDRVRRVSSKFIMENLTRGQASFALQTLLGVPAKEKWKIEIPARPFLGITSKDATQYTTELARTALQYIKKA